jgi:hypothetical protein
MATTHSPALDAQERQIGRLVLAHHCAAVDPLAARLRAYLHRHVGRALDDVAVGHDEAVFADQEPGADAAHRSGLAALGGAVRLLQELVEGVDRRGAGRGGGDDADHRRHGGLE